MPSESNSQKNKPWHKSTSHDSFESADAARNKLLALWLSDPVRYTGMQVKVKRMSGEKFIVKFRLHPDFEPAKKEKKTRGKSSRRNKKNSNRRKFSTS